MGVQGPWWAAAIVSLVIFLSLFVAGTASQMQHELPRSALQRAQVRGSRVIGLGLLRVLAGAASDWSLALHQGNKLPETKRLVPSRWPSPQKLKRAQFPPTKQRRATSGCLPFSVLLHYIFDFVWTSTSSSKLIPDTAHRWPPCLSATTLPRDLARSRHTAGSFNKYSSIVFDENETPLSYWPKSFIGYEVSPRRFSTKHHLSVF